MKRLKDTGLLLELNKFEINNRFKVFNLGNYDFNDDLDFGESAGVYIFTTKDVCSHQSNEYKREVYYHTLHYCGMTKNFNTRFEGHFKAEDLQKSNVDHICICKCPNQYESDKLEELLLSKINFTYNIKDNSTNNKTVKCEAV